jgi:hypothetical protein
MDATLVAYVANVFELPEIRLAETARHEDAEAKVTESLER